MDKNLEQVDYLEGPPLSAKDMGIQENVLGSGVLQKKSDIVKTSEASRPKTFDVITQEQVTTYKRRLDDDYNIDLSDVKVAIVQPGDALFDKEEIKFKYFQRGEDPSLKEVGTLLGQFENNPDSVDINHLRSVAESQGILLEGRLPGFANVATDNQINFFAIQEQDAIAMAQKYATKEGESGKTFATIDEAKQYLQGLGEKVFLHEAGHIVHGRVDPDKLTPWNGFVSQDQQLTNQIISVQLDKYIDEGDIPIAEEAFADYFVDVVSGGRIRSRLGDNPSATERVRNLLDFRPQFDTTSPISVQPDNTANSPTEVTDALTALRERLRNATQVTIENHSPNTTSFTPTGEIKE